MRSIQEWLEYMRKQQKQPGQPERPRSQAPAKGTVSQRQAFRAPVRSSSPAKAHLPQDAHEVSKGGPPPVPIQVPGAEGEVRPVGAKRTPPAAEQPKPAPQPAQPSQRRTKAEASPAAGEVVARAGTLSAERERLRHLLSATREALQVQLPLAGLPARTPAQRRKQQQLEERREALLARIANPELSVQQVALLLRVSPGTIRRYTGRGLLKSHRTKGNQRRFWLADLLAFLSKSRAE